MKIYMREMGTKGTIETMHVVDVNCPKCHEWFTIYGSAPRIVEVACRKCGTLFELEVKDSK